MALPKVTQTISDGALGIAESDDSSTHVAIGVCSAGTVNALTFYSDPDTLKAACGIGPLVDKCVYHLQVAGGSVGVMRINSSIVGACGSTTVVRGGAGDSTGTCAGSGQAYDAFEFKVEITKQGTNLAAGTATFKYSVDGGDNYSPDIAVPIGGTYAVPNTNVTLTFGNGAGPTSFKVGDVHSFTCTAPGYSSTDADNALNALRTTYASSKFGFVHLVGAASTVAGAATIAAAVDVKMAAEESLFRYLFAVVECPEDTDANIIAAFTAFSSTRVCVAAGYCELVANGKVLKRNAAWPAVARMASQDIRRDLARVRQDKEGGPLKGVTKLYRDEFATEGLDAARFITLRTYAQQNGFYITNGRTMANGGSDYQYLQFRRLMDRACTVNYGNVFQYLNDDELRVTDTGTILDADAKAIETKVNGALFADLTAKKRVSTTFVTVTRDNNILSTMTLKMKVRLRPKGYSKFIEADIGFENPALTPAAP
jgi:hypothetical protein